MTAEYVFLCAGFAVLVFVVLCLTAGRWLANWFYGDKPGNRR